MSEKTASVSAEATMMDDWETVGVQCTSGDTIERIGKDRGTQLGKAEYRRLMVGNHKSATSISIRSAGAGKISQLPVLPPPTNFTTIKLLSIIFEHLAAIRGNQSLGPSARRIKALGSINQTLLDVEDIWIIIDNKETTLKCATKAIYNDLLAILLEYKDSFTANAIVQNIRQALLEDKFLMLSELTDVFYALGRDVVVTEEELEVILELMVFERTLKGKDASEIETKIKAQPKDNPENNYSPLLFVRHMAPFVDLKASGALVPDQTYALSPSHPYYHHKPILSLAMRRRRKNQPSIKDDHDFVLLYGECIRIEMSKADKSRLDAEEKQLEPPNLNPDYERWRLYNMFRVTRSVFHNDTGLGKTVQEILHNTISRGRVLGAQQKLHIAKLLSSPTTEITISKRAANAIVAELHRAQLIHQQQMAELTLEVNRSAVRLTDSTETVALDALMPIFQNLIAEHNKQMIEYIFQLVNVT